MKYVIDSIANILKWLQLIAQSTMYTISATKLLLWATKYNAQNNWSSIKLLQLPWLSCKVHTANNQLIRATLHHARNEPSSWMPVGLSVCHHSRLPPIHGRVTVHISCWCPWQRNKDALWILLFPGFWPSGIPPFSQCRWTHRPYALCKTRTQSQLASCSSNLHVCCRSRQNSH